MRRLCCLLLLLGGCDEPKPARPAASAAPIATTASSSARPAPSSSAAPGSQYRDDEVPVEGDFEEQIEKDVTADNYKDKLSALEQELAGNAPPSPAPSASAKAHDDD